ncbi:hypothetical protein [Kribbella monticola]|uniref:hypothetical protein n=1 Tax=Kribbella monticola TaxID=2185285 RepID=UPI0013005B7A|nr:hypothetical protein [Kribbella monticola]
MARVVFVVQIEVDSTGELLDLVRSTHVFEADDLRLEFRPSDEGRGFGLTEVVDIIVEVGVAVTSTVIADSIRSSIKGVIRRARSRGHRSDGSPEGISELIEKARSEEDPEADSAPGPDEPDRRP